MENNNTGGEIAKRTTTANPSREPFSDVSNAASSSLLPLLLNPNRKRTFRSKSKQLQPQPEPDPSPDEFPTSATATATAASCSTTVASDLDDSVSGDRNILDMSEPTTTYKRRTTRRREHMPNATSTDALSCPPHKRKIKENKEKKSKKGDNNVHQHVISSAPCKRRKKPENFTLPEDFVREQRDYFARIDEEELIVEEAEKEQFQYFKTSKDNNTQGEGG